MEKDKLNFAKNCKKIEYKIKHRNKTFKNCSIFLGLCSLGITLLSLLFTGVATLTYCIFPISLLVIQYWQIYYSNRKDIDMCNNGCKQQFTYRDYKQMKKSDELDKLYQQIEEIQKQEANEMHSQYLDFVKGKTYTTVKTSFVENNQETENDNNIEINNNL